MVFEGWRYDPNSGHIFNKEGKRVGSYTKGRGRVYTQGVTYYTSRVAFYLHTGCWPKHHIDHINRDQKDDRWENLRDVTQKKNNYNKGVYKTNSLGVKGVFPSNGKYLAQIQKDGVKVHLGTFNSVIEAKAAYEECAAKLYGEYYIGS